MSIKFNAENNKGKIVSISDVVVGDYIETEIGGIKVIGEVCHFEFGSLFVTIRDCLSGAKYSVISTRKCCIIEDVSITYKYKEHERTDKERIDFLNNHLYYGRVKCGNGANTYDGSFRNCDDIRESIDDIMDHLL